MRRIGEQRFEFSVRIFRSRWRPATLESVSGWTSAPVFASSMRDDRIFLVVFDDDQSGSVFGDGAVLRR